MLPTQDLTIIHAGPHDTLTDGAPLTLVRKHLGLPPEAPLLPGWVGTEARPPFVPADWRPVARVNSEHGAGWRLVWGPPRDG